MGCKGLARFYWLLDLANVNQAFKVCDASRVVLPVLYPSIGLTRQYLEVKYVLRAGSRRDVLREHIKEEYSSGLGLEPVE